MIEWFHPSWIDDKANGLKTDGFVEAKVAPSLREIVGTACKYNISYVALR